MRIRSTLALILLAPHTLAQFVEEDVTTVYVVPGEAAGDNFGLELVALADYDGDGARELLVSAPGNDEGATNAGKAYLLDGATGTVLRGHAGSRVNEARRNVCDAGDIDGDSVLDYLVGTGDDWVYVYSGASGDELLGLAGTPGETFGFRSCGVGDLNGDGHGELLVGAPGHDSPFANAGRAYIYSGVDGSLFREHAGDALQGSLGHTVARLGDLDGDGAAEYSIAAPGAYSAAQPGEVRVYSGATGVELLPRLTPAGSGRLFGGWVPSLGGLDLSGDGVPDFTVTDLGDQGNDTGRLYVYDGATRALLFDVQGYSVNSGFGGVPPNPASHVGDVNGDGVPDLLVGSWESQVGAINGGQADLVSGAGGARLRTITSNKNGHFLGGSAAGVGFADGDDIPDFALGANGFNSSRGRVYVISGHSTVGSNYCSVQPNSTGAPARITASGSTSIAANDLTLTAGPVPDQFFVFFFGPQAAETTFGNGYLCVTGGLTRLVPPALASAAVATRGIDLPTEVGLAGTWRFQCWYRDPAGGGAGFNLSDGVAVTLH